MLRTWRGCLRGIHGSPATAVRWLSAASQPDDVFDVVIVGGGMVGAAFAALLVHNPLTASMRIAVLDQKAQPMTWQAPAVPELRVSTITPASMHCLKQAGAWPAIEPWAHPFHTMQVWDSPRTGPDAGSPTGGAIRWRAQDVGSAHMGVVVENSLLQAALLSAASRAPGSPPGPPPTHTASQASPSSAAPGADAQPGGTGGGPGPGPAASQGSGAGAEPCHFLWPAEVEALTLPALGAGGMGVPGHSPPEGASAQGGGTGSSSSSSNLAQLVLKGGRTLAARLVVAADGGESRVRALAGLRTWGWEYGQRGVVATVSCAGGPEASGTAWQRFLPTGPLALLPVRGGLFNIVWSTTPDMARQLEAMSPTQFAAVTNKALGGGGSEAGDARPGSPPTPWSTLMASLGSAADRLVPAGDQYCPPPLVEQWVGPRPRSFPLRLRHSGRYALPRLALIGDAAHVVHPLAGQGVNLGLGDALALAHALAAAREYGQDIGDPLLLQAQYEAPRRTANLAMMAALDSLKHAFALQSSPFAAARNLGLGLLNASGPVKNQIMQFAMGMS